MQHVHHTLKNDLTKTILLWSASFFALLGIVFMLSFNTLEGYILELMADHRLNYQVKEFAKHLDEKDTRSIREESDALIQETMISAIIMIDASGELMHVSLSDHQQPQLYLNHPLSTDSLQSLVDSHGNLHLFTRQITGHHATLALVLDDRPIEIAIFSATASALVMMILLVLVSIKALHFTLKRQLVEPIEQLRQAVDNKHIDDDAIHQLEEELPDEAAQILEVVDSLKHSRDDIKIHITEMMDASPSCFWWSDDGNTYSGVSGHTPLLCKSKDNIKGTPLWTWAGDTAHTSGNSRQLQQAIKNREEKLDFAYQVHCCNQSFWFGESITLCYDHHGQLDTVYGIINDISARKIKQEEQAEQQELVHRMEATATLVGGIAHEFNNALAGMNGNVFLIKQSADDEQTLNRIGRIEQLIERSAAMIDKMLSFARQSPLRPDPIDLVNFLKEFQLAALPSLPDRAKFNLQLDDGLAVGGNQPIIQADRKKLHEVLMQLIQNADFAVANVSMPRIAITLELLEADEPLLHKYAGLSSTHLIHLQVQDNGCGIPAENLGRIFEPFFTTREVGQGTGLGLSMVYGYINQIGGAIDVESSIDTGTTFHIYLPRTNSPQATKHEDSLLRGHGEHILVVDDDVVFRESTCEVLNRMGYHTLAAMNGKQAIELFEQHKAEIRLIFMDILMPGLTGIQASRRIRDIDADIPIIFLTAYDRTQPLEPEVYAENAELINKPFRISVLSQAIQKALHPSDNIPAD